MRETTKKNWKVKNFEDVPGKYKDTFKHSIIAKGQVFMTAQIFGYIKSSSKSKSNLKNIEMGEIDNSLTDAQYSIRKGQGNCLRQTRCALHKCI